MHSALSWAPASGALASNIDQRFIVTEPAVHRDVVGEAVR